MNVLNIANRIVMLVSLIFLSSCYKEIIVEQGYGLIDWTTETHSSLSSSNYEIVFPDNKVNRIDIVIGTENWQIMLDDMESKYGEFGTGNASGPGGPPPGGPGNLDDNEDPVFVASSVFFEGVEWYHVGIRFKGNSSLSGAWNNGVWKISFKLDFDEFENEYPEITDQRFYGFRQLSLKNNYEDDSQMREKITSEIFRSAGIPSPYTAYYRVFVDYGEGPTYFGLYTMVEEIDDTMIEDQFDQANGNIYKPEGTGATFAEGTFSTSDIEKKNNLDSDWSDVLELYTSINSNLRLENNEQWKTNLEAILNLDEFLHWLAVNTVVQNWDTYGKMNHNYYLYNNPEDNLITWIPWDNNEALSKGKQGGALSISLDEVGADWPLISYIMEDDNYQNIYKNHIEAFVNSSFEPERMKTIYQHDYDLISEYVIGEDGENSGYTFLNLSADFANALTELENHVDERYQIANQYINN